MLPSKDRNETNIGHGGPGLRLLTKIRSMRWYCAVALLCYGLVLPASIAIAQDTAASDDAAKRIEQLRDQAGVSSGDDVVDAQPSTTQEALSPLDESVGAVEKPLPANESLPLGAGEGALFGGESTQAETSSLGDGWLLSTLASLGIVLAIVFGIRWILKRGGVVSPSVSSSSVVEVLSRTTVAPRSHVILMRVGQRILVVSDSSAGMRTLASVHEAEEVADLLGAVDASKATSMSQNFGSVMKKLSGQWSDEEDSLDEPSELDEERRNRVVDQAEGALSRVRGRLAALSGTGGGRE